MPGFRPFAMERWQSTFENRVAHNLTESGVEPLALGELLALGGESVAHVKIGYGQSNGSDELRATIARFYPGASDAGVVVCNGSAEANFVALWELLQPGDTAVVVTPTYMQTPGLAENFGARVVTLPLHAELGWQPDPGEVRRLVTGDVRLLVITNPNNPTGAQLDAESRRALVEAAARTGAWILADEVYTGAELDGIPTPTFFGEYPRVIATGSLSKAYGLPGLRVGWAVTSTELAERLWARRDYTTISPGELTDRLAVLALGDVIRPELLARTRGIIRRGLGVLEPYLERWGCSWQPPRAGAVCFARYPWEVNSSVLAERLRTRESVLVVPGDHFGLDRFIRFGIGIPDDTHREALERIDRLIARTG